MPVPLTPHQSTTYAAEESPSPIPRQEDQDDNIETGELSPHPDLEDIGLPSDDVWDHDGAYAERYCYDHGEIEYLLGTPNRWMSAASLGVSEAVLGTRLQKRQVRPVKSTPAQCWGTLYSHVRRVVRKAGHADGDLYDLEWWRHWTPASCIQDPNWAVESLALHNMNLSLRRSTRLTETVDERKMRNEQIARIVNLDL